MDISSNSERGSSTSSGSESGHESSTSGDDSISVSDSDVSETILGPGTGDKSGEDHPKLPPAAECPVELETDITNDGVVEIEDVENDNAVWTVQKQDWTSFVVSNSIVFFFPWSCFALRLICFLLVFLSSLVLLLAGDESGMASRASKPH